MKRMGWRTTVALGLALGCALLVGGDGPRAARASTATAGPATVTLTCGPTLNRPADGNGPEVTGHLFQDGDGVAMLEGTIFPGPDRWLVSVDLIERQAVSTEGAGNITDELAALVRPVQVAAVDAPNGCGTVWSATVVVTLPSLASDYVVRFHFEERRGVARVGRTLSWPIPATK